MKINLIAGLLVISAFFRGQVTFTLPSEVCSSSTPTVVCSTGTIVATGYTWSAPGTGVQFSAPNASATALNFMATFPGTVTISVIVSTNNGTASFSATTILNSFPAITVVPSSSAVCPGSMATLTALGAKSFTWKFAGGSSVQSSVAVGPAGTFTAVGMNGACADSITFTIGVQDCTSIDPIVNDVLSVGPTIAVDKVAIRSNLNLESAVIMNLQGGLVGSSVLSSTENNVDVSALVPGAYFLVISDDSGHRYIRRFCKVLE